MFARFARLSSIAVAAAALTLTSGTALAHATEADSRFLSTLAQLGIEFPTVDQAIAAGNNICDIVAEGSANRVDPAEIRSAIVNSIGGYGLSEGVALQLMSGAVDAYCPEYDAIAGG